MMIVNVLFFFALCCVVNLKSCTCTNMSALAPDAVRLTDNNGTTFDSIVLVRRTGPSSEDTEPGNQAPSSPMLTEEKEEERRQLTQTLDRLIARRTHLRNALVSHSISNGWQEQEQHFPHTSPPGPDADVEKLEDSIQAVLLEVKMLNKYAMMAFGRQAVQGNSFKKGWEPAGSNASTGFRSQQRDVEQGTTDDDTQ